MGPIGQIRKAENKKQKAEPEAEFDRKAEKSTSMVPTYYITAIMTNIYPVYHNVLIEKVKTFTIK